MLLRDYVNDNLPMLTGSIFKPIVFSMVYEIAVRYLEKKITRGEFVSELVNLGYDNFQVIRFIDDLNKREVKIETQTPGGV